MKAIELLGAAVGLLMRAVDWLTFKRRGWREERKP